MGGNGSFILKSTDSEAGRRWKTVATTPSGIKIIELKNPKDSFSFPVESHSPNSIYAIFNKGGKGLKGIAKHGPDGKKIFEIHTTDHKGLGIHFHPWKDGHPLDAKPITKEMKKMLDDVLNFKMNMAREDYVKKDLAGYWFNAKYMPDYSRNGGLYNGYKNSVEETLFFDFAVQGYDLGFTYKGNRYYFLSESDHVALSDEHFTEEYQRFEDGNSALEQFHIDGKSIIELINQLEDVESY